MFMWYFDPLGTDGTGHDKREASLMREICESGTGFITLTAAAF